MKKTVKVVGQKKPLSWEYLSPNVEFSGAMLAEGPFCIHPNSEPFGPVHVLYNDGKWHFVMPETMKQKQLRDVKMAYLYPAQFQDGRYFLFIYTIPKTEWEKKTQCSILKVISKAKSHYVKREYDKVNTTHRIQQTFDAVMPDAFWPTLDLIYWVNAAFKGRVIDMNHPIALTAHDHEEIIEEEML